MDGKSRGEEASLHETLVQSLVLLVVIGILAQWVAWRLRLPSILLLLAVGFVAGPGFHVVDTRRIFGELLVPVISLSVCLVLFEGGLTLRLRDLGAHGAVVRNLVSVGAAASFGITLLLARWLLGMEWDLALLAGAVLVVTGPTVVGPLLRHVRPTGAVGPILRWEGIVIDPIGATLALLVFEGMLQQSLGASLSTAARGFAMTILAGGSAGLLAGWALYQILRRHLAPDYLETPVCLVLVLGAFAAANSVQAESGLLAVTVMGVALANQRSVSIQHILEFKENLQVLLISSLFLILAAGLSPEDLRLLDWRAGLFAASLVVVARPAAVFLSTLRSGLAWRERLFLSMLAPRGIVAAAVASLFALQLQGAGREDAALLVPVTFLVIFVTVAFYGVTASWTARWLRLSIPNPQGVLFVGGSPLVRSIASALQAEGIAVLIIDTNRRNISAARLGGIPALQESVLGEEVAERLELGEMGHFLAMTSNAEVNYLAALHFIEVFGKKATYHVRMDDVPVSEGDVAPHLRGRFLFDEGATLSRLELYHERGARVRRTLLTKEFDLDAYLARHGESAIPLFAVADGRLTVFSGKDGPQPKVGQTLMSLVLEREEAPSAEGGSEAAGGGKEA